MVDDGCSGDVIRLVRADTPPTIAAARSLFAAYARSLPFSLDFQGFDDELAGLPGRYAPPGGSLLLALAGEQAVGCAGLRPLAPGCAEMKRLYAAPAWRGRGLGRRLATRLVVEARELGYRAIRLDTLDSMPEARGLYRTLGFRPIPAYYANPIAGAEYLELDLDRRRDAGCLPGGA